MRLPVQRLWHPLLLSRGRGNRVEGRGPGAAFLRLATTVYGTSSDNVVEVGRNFSTGGARIHIAGAGNRVVIGDDVRFSGSIRVHGFGLRVSIGHRSDVKRTHIVAWEANVAIGDDCLVAARVHLRSNDIHPITDRATGARLNPPRDVVVGSRVWIATEAVFLKGARVADDCVVGFRALVTRAFEEPACVIAGNPARIVRRGIAWAR